MTGTMMRPATLGALYLVVLGSTFLHVLMPREALLLSLAILLHHFLTILVIGTAPANSAWLASTFSVPIVSSSGGGSWAAECAMTFFAVLLPSLAMIYPQAQSLEDCRREDFVRERRRLHQRNTNVGRMALRSNDLGRTLSHSCSRCYRARQLALHPLPFPAPNQLRLVGNFLPPAIIQHIQVRVYFHNRRPVGPFIQVSLFFPAASIFLAAHN